MADSTGVIGGVQVKMRANADGTFALASFDISNENVWSATVDSTANAARTLTKVVPGAGKYHYITAIEIVTSGAAAGADISCTLKDDNAGTPVSYWKTVIGSGAARGTRVGIVFSSPIKLRENKTADLVVTAGGTGLITSLSMSGYSL